MNTCLPTPPVSNQPSMRNRYVALVTTFLIGPLLIIAATLLLNVVEHQIDYAKLAQKAPRFSANHISPEAEQFPLVAVTGKVTLPHLLGDNAHLNPGKYLQYTRITEVYAWVENHKAKHTHDAQGRNIVQPELTYAPAWTSTPIPAEKFAEPQGHQNPLLEFEATPHNAASFKLGQYDVESETLQLPPSKMLNLSPSTVSIQPPEHIIKNFIYKPKHPHTTFSNPLIGDTKTSYAVVKGDGKTATIFGKITGTTITPACLQKSTSGEPDETFQRLFWGTPDDAQAILATEDAPPTLLGRIIAYLLMFLGLLAFLRPMQTHFGHLPLTKHASLRLITLISLVFFGECILLINVITNIGYILGLLGCMLGAIVSWLRNTGNSVDL